MKKFTMIDALKKRDASIVFATLVTAENEYRKMWLEKMNSSIVEGYGEMYAGHRITDVLDDKKYKFACCLREDQEDEFTLDEWVNGGCVGALDEYICKGRIWCDEMSGDTGCLPCCYRNVSLAAFLKTMFEDEAEEIVKEMYNINNEED